MNLLASPAGHSFSVDKKKVADKASKETDFALSKRQVKETSSAFIFKVIGITTCVKQEGFFTKA